MTWRAPPQTFKILFTSRSDMSRCDSLAFRTWSLFILCELGTTVNKPAQTLNPKPFHAKVPAKTRVKGTAGPQRSSRREAGRLPLQPASKAAGPWWRSAAQLKLSCPTENLYVCIKWSATTMQEDSEWYFCCSHLLFFFFFSTFTFFSLSLSLSDSEVMKV